jgi:hypothetical protein
MLTNLHARAAGLAAVATVITSLSRSWPATSADWLSIAGTALLGLVATLAPNSASAPGSN